MCETIRFVMQELRASSPFFSVLFCSIEVELKWHDRFSDVVVVAQFHFKQIVCLTTN